MKDSQKKNATGQGGAAFSNTSKINYSSLQKQYGITNPREARVLRALCERPHTRTELDRIAGSTNAPDIVLRLRNAGVDIMTQFRPHVDRDGKPGKHGLYSLVLP